MDAEFADGCIAGAAYTDSVPACCDVFRTTLDCDVLHEQAFVAHYKTFCDQANYVPRLVEAVVRSLAGSF